MRIEEYIEQDMGIQDKSFKDKMLNGIWRNHVIDKVKYPLLRAILVAAGSLPDKPTRENCTEPNTLVLMDIIDRLFKKFVCPGRVELYKSAFDIILAEVEHDVVPASVLGYLAGEIHKEILAGNFKVNEGTCIQKNVWKED